MSLEDTITEIVESLREGSFPNEQSISQGIVLRILSELDWDVFNPKFVWPEYVTAEGGRADFALCGPHSKPKVLIEVKQPGRESAGVRQLLEYAFHTGVPFVVLSDGQTWSFFLPAESGDYEDRRVFKLDLFQHPANRCAEVLCRYLGRQDVVSGKSLESARSEYRSQESRTRARQAIPQAWARLVDQRDELLIEVLSEAVESKEGIQPAEEDVAGFLSHLGIRSAPPSPTPRPVRPTPAEKPTVRDAVATKNTANSANLPAKPLKQGTVVLLGEEHPFRNAKERLVIVLRELAERDKMFLERCYQNSSFRGTSRRYISRRVEELYPGRTDLQESQVDPLPYGWQLGTNLSNRQKEVLIQAAVKVAGLEIGRDIKI